MLSTFFNLSIDLQYLIVFLLGVQLNFFRKGLKYLETIEPHVKAVADREHIDYVFSGLEDDDTGEEDDEDYYSYDSNDDGELSFDYYQETLSSSTNLMEVGEFFLF